MIRIIAMITMLIDHIGAVFYPDKLTFRIIGRLAFPLFAFGIAKGYRYSRDIKRYAMRLLLLGIITQLPYWLLFRTENLNICFTLLAGLLLIVFYNERNKFISILGIIGIMAVAGLLNFEYGIYGLLTVFVFYIYWDKPKVVLSQAIITVLCTWAYGLHPIQIFSILSSFIVVYLNKYDFKLNRALTYGFYPVHIILLLLIKSF